MLGLVCVICYVCLCISCFIVCNLCVLLFYALWFYVCLRHLRRHLRLVPLPAALVHAPGRLPGDVFVGLFRVVFVVVVFV